MTKKGKEYKETFIKQLPKTKIIDYPIEVEIKLFFKDKRRRDVDNYNKVILDCLNKTVLTDDSLIFRLTTEKFIGQKEDKVEISIQRYENE